ncbi:MAG TPA: hypothetical protein PLP23_06120 [Panacibacter sp.]|nr:hypothetical protein [Panacibacter sp.]
MNSNVKNSIIKMEADELSKLITEVKETVATNVNEKQIFSAADLWNIQKAMRTAHKLSRKRDIHN